MEEYQESCSCCSTHQTQQQGLHSTCRSLQQHQHQQQGLHKPKKIDHSIENGDKITFKYQIINNETLEVIESTTDDLPITITIGKNQLRFEELENEIKQMKELNQKIEIYSNDKKYKFIIELISINNNNENGSIDEWELTDEERYHSSFNKKEEGNLYFAENKYIPASRCYRIGIKQLRKINKLKWDLNESKTRELLITLFNNLLTCEMKLKRYKNVIRFSTECIENIGINVKTYYKRGEAYMMNGEYKEAINDFNKAIDLLLNIKDKVEDANLVCKVISGSSKISSVNNNSIEYYDKMLKLIQNTLQKCKKLNSEYEETCKRMYKNLF
ncbi:hypothetical protein ABK040_009647 [Willaertia magna]